MKKNNKKRIIKKYVIIVLLLVIAISYILGMLVYDGSVGSAQQVKNDEVIQVFSNEANKPLEKLKNYNCENKMITTSNGYDIEALFINSNKKTDNTVIVVHGIEKQYYDVLDTAFNYLENGYNVLVYNQRHTGNTGGKDYTFGLYERYDLDAAVRYVKNKIPNGKLGVHGFSMGAATSLMHSKINENDKNVDFYIIDSPYHEMADAIKLGIEDVNIPLIPTGYIRLLGNLFTKVKSGFWYSDVEPYKAVQKISVPMMLIHGTADNVCAPESSKIVYDNIPHNKKELWYIEGSKHIKGRLDIGQEYYDRIYKFINKYV